MPESSGPPSVIDVTVRYSDLGPDGRVTTAGLARWFEDARVGLRFPRFAQLLNDGGFSPVRYLLASQEVERLGAIGFHDKVRVRGGIRRIGRTSFTYGYAVHADDRHVGAGETVSVFAGDAGPVVLPDELRADLEEMRLDEADDAPGAPRPGPERRDRSHYPFAIGLRARVGDIDTNRHANNVALLTWYAEAVAALAAEALDSGWGGPPPELAPWRFRLQYVAEVGYPAEYTIGLAVNGHDDDTVDYVLGLFHGDDCVGLAEATSARGDLPADVLARSAFRATQSSRSSIAVPASTIGSR